MTIVWGGFTNHLRIGIDCWTDGYDTYTPTINVYVDVYVQCDSSFNFDDSQTAVLSGNASGSWTFQNTLQANQSVFVGRAVIGGQGQSYGGGPTYSFSAVLNGVYLGAGPSVGRTFDLPPRPIRAPNQPGAPAVNAGPTATTVGITYASPTDVGGSGLDYSWLQVGTSNFGGVFYDNQTPGWVGRSLTGLAPNITYYARAAAHNAAGWGPFSGVGSFTTTSYAVATPTLSNINPDSLTVTWAAPSDPAGPSSYELQYATDAGFTSPTTLSGGWATSRTVTGLTPATAYYFRVRANPGTGWGAYSPAATTSTLSGAKVRVAGAWVNGVARVRVGGAWVLVKVNKRVSGSWVL